MISKNTFDFLNQLNENNNRDWFADHKSEFQKIDKEAKSFFNEIYTDFQKDDSLEKIQFYRIYRDVRFSKDKTPYNKHLSASYARTKPMLRGGYYIRIENNASFVGGGFWEPNTEDLLRIRKEIELDASELREIINESTFKHFFGKLEGEELKSAPRNFDKNHPDIDLIRKKQFLVSRSFTNEEVLASNFKEEIIATFKAMRPFFNYMSDVLTTNLNGESII
ncbi:DUF2461 domain-containing protein [Flavobacterium sediminilitoris]|uniref:DUF2461 domain-containing protein n=1 Tax=Flavobacterium sediminilitoris TaxID=2024526 RepID=A0ABY4HK48_9FLAO|nr:MULTISPECIES: DUF2461 domain-containing protein [Flavobacterium]UOX33239.1 DUF2461 domain-containing protein [Flavobacterium sediminilitoris]